MSEAISSWWDGLSPELRSQAAAVAAGPEPHPLQVDELTTSMLQAGLSTSRPVWTGQPEHLLQMDPEVVSFVRRQGHQSK